MASSIYLILIDKTQELLYYMVDEEDKPRSILNLKGALISQLCTIKDRDHCFLIEILPPNGKNYYFSFSSEEEAREWRNSIQRCTQINSAQVQDEGKPARTSLLLSGKFPQAVNQRIADTEEEKTLGLERNSSEILERASKPKGNAGNLEEEKEKKEPPEDIEEFIKDVSSYVMEEQADWKSLKFKQGMKISTLGETEYYPIINWRLVISNVCKDI